MPKITTPAQRIATDAADRRAAAKAAAMLATLPSPTTAREAAEQRELVKLAEAALCRMRRNAEKLVADAEAAAPAPSRTLSTEDVCGCPEGYAEGITEAECGCRA